MNRNDNEFVGCRYYERTLRTKYTMSIERENVVLNRKVSDVLRRNRQLVRDLERANSNVETLEDEVHRLEQLLTQECDPENDPYEIVDDVELSTSPIVLKNQFHGTKIFIHKGEEPETEKEGEESEEENLEPAENEVNEEPALDMSASDYEREEEEEEVCASGDVDVKSGGTLEVSNTPQCEWGDWTYSLSVGDIARY